MAGACPPCATSLGGEQSDHFESNRKLIRTQLLLKNYMGLGELFPFVFVVPFMERFSILKFSLSGIVVGATKC